MPRIILQNVISYVITPVVVDTYSETQNEYYADRRILFALKMSLIRHTCHSRETPQKR